MKIAEKESELYRFYARFEELETLMNEVRMKREEVRLFLWLVAIHWSCQTWKRIIDAIRDYEQQRMRCEDIISSKSAYLGDRDVFFENMSDKVIQKM